MNNSKLVNKTNSMKNITSCRSFTIKECIQYIIDRNNSVVYLSELVKELNLTTPAESMLRRELNNIDSRSGQIRYLTPLSERAVVYVGEVDEANTNILLATEAALENLQVNKSERQTLRESLIHFFKNEMNINNKERTCLRN